MKIVSACLAGIPCRYDGKSCPHKEVLELVEKGEALPLCPEQLGGLPTPRVPVELVGMRVLSAEGKDYTKEFLKGAGIVANLAQITGAKEAILREYSPSCGVNFVYDGTFQGKAVPGMGLSAKALADLGLRLRALS